MNAEELWETTMDRKTRTLKTVSVHEAEEADRVFEMLMGSEVGPRKSFIQTYAKQANLDI
jgi:DNA gyrase subunit B